jgi:hypothetical protein
MGMISRRDRLVGASAGLAAVAIHPLLIWAAEQEGVCIPGEEGMIVRSARFFDLEMPPEFFDSWITPVLCVCSLPLLRAQRLKSDTSWRPVVGRSM